ncbi:hypothetical protein [Actinophytocola gossypii]|uniref:Uncharacterized protein n=1 Tax=Actinophytocola gossypii TaxID=2812003 RepID=A0ABT2J101_9PSEU|nr:hypothetical protein [Actinophytocola gossypii]MCT2581543.1 hypothetical protein [Actinophytocola gossypii]
MLGRSDQITGLGPLPELGIDDLYASVRARRTVPTWARAGHDAIDVVNELTLVVRRGRLVVIHTPLSDQVLRTWLRRFDKLYRYLPSAILRRTFHGDGKAVWLRGVHPRRDTKADSKTLGGRRVQKALDDDEDASYALSAATIDHLPADEAALVRGRLTVSPARSRVYWKYGIDLATYLAAVRETVDVLDKALAVEPPDELFPQLAIPETDLANVRGAYDLSIANVDEMFDRDETDDDLSARAELLRGAILEVIGRPDAAAFTVVVGHEGSEVGRLAIRPQPRGDAFDLDVRLAGAPSWDDKVREVRDAIGDGDLLSVYYESGHTYSEHQVNVEKQTAPPFANLVFADFAGYRVTQEKPAAPNDQGIHDAIGRNGDTSLFAWVTRHYRGGWLVCDDGPGEVADFLHLVDGTLTAIHVKGANSASLDRRVSVTAYQEVVAQAEKNVRSLYGDHLVDRLTTPRSAPRAAWLDGERIADLSGFVRELGRRTAVDRTRVEIVQPHLLRSVHDTARAAADTASPTRDSRSLTLLDGLLRSARRSVTALWDDLVVIGCE